MHGIDIFAITMHNCLLRPIVIPPYFLFIYSRMTSEGKSIFSFVSPLSILYYRVSSESHSFPDNIMYVRTHLQCDILPPEGQEE